ncbi:MAG: glycosyltransferase family 2 protein [Candidatus Nanopusillus sp.]
MDKNLISVIVTAYNRRKYLPFALKSLEKQTLPKEMFEVIVVKNFEDNISDEIISRNKWKNIVTDEKSLSSKIAIGFKESKGDIITFLEDDDLYREDRLAKVYETFNKFNDLIYFHNSQVIIDENGNRLKDPIYQDLKPKIKNILIPNDKNFIIKTSTLKNIAKFAKMNPYDFLFFYITDKGYYNNSSIAIKRDIINKYIELFKKIIIALDKFFYTISLASEGSIFFTDDELTYYRVHKESHSTFHRFDQKYHNKLYYYKITLRTLEYANDLKILSEITQSLNKQQVPCNFDKLQASNPKKELQWLPFKEIKYLPKEFKLSINDLNYLLRCLPHYYSISKQIKDEDFQKWLIKSVPYFILSYIMQITGSERIREIYFKFSKTYK